MLSTNEKTTAQYWNAVHARPRLRLPSPFIASNRDLQQLLKRYIAPGMQVLEIGCAPGKQLAWVAKVIGAKVCGLDYSERGLQHCRALFNALGISADLRCENFFRTSFAPDSFDVVYSFGVVEHFEDPASAVQCHLRLAKPGGKVIITVPNYGGVYGRLQRRYDPQNLALHNLGIMSCRSLAGLTPELVSEARAYACGRLSPWLVHFHRKWPSWLAKILSHSLNLAALLQPAELQFLAPMLVLAMTKQRLSAI